MVSFDLKSYREFQKLIRIGNAGVRDAQEESRRMGVPNVYCINGITYYELSNGELSRQDPYVTPESK